MRKFFFSRGMKNLPLRSICDDEGCIFSAPLQPESSSNVRGTKVEHVVNAVLFKQASGGASKEERNIQLLHVNHTIFAIRHQAANSQEHEDREEGVGFTFLIVVLIYFES